MMQWRGDLSCWQIEIWNIEAVGSFTYQATHLRWENEVDTQNRILSANQVYFF